MKKYIKLTDFMEDHQSILDTIESDLALFLKALSTPLKEVYRTITKMQASHNFDTVLFYVADPNNLEYLQLFFKNSKTDTAEYWDYRGTRVLETQKKNPIHRLDRTIVDLLTPDIEDWFELGDENYPMTGDFHPIITEEIPIYLSEKIATFFYENYDASSFAWEGCYVDFFAASSFHNGEVFDILNNKWVRLK